MPPRTNLLPDFIDDHTLFIGSSPSPINSLANPPFWQPNNKIQRGGDVITPWQGPDGSVGGLGSDPTTGWGGITYGSQVGGGPSNFGVPGSGGASTGGTSTGGDPPFNPSEVNYAKLKITADEQKKRDELVSLLDWINSVGGLLKNPTDRLDIPSVVQGSLDAILTLLTLLVLFAGKRMAFIDDLERKEESPGAPEPNLLDRESLIFQNVFNGDETLKRNFLDAILKYRDFVLKELFNLQNPVYTVPPFTHAEYLKLMNKLQEDLNILYDDFFPIRRARGRTK